MLRTVRSISIMFLVATALLTGVFSAQTAFATEAQPNFTWHIRWGVEEGQDSWWTHTSMTSSITDTVYEWVWFPYQHQAGGITKTVGLEPISSLWKADNHISSMSEIRLYQSINGAKFANSEFDLSCLPGPNFGLEQYDEDVVVEFQNTMSRTVKVEFVDDVGPRILEVVANRIVTQAMELNGEVRVFNDTQQTLCGRLSFEFDPDLDPLPTPDKQFLFMPAMY